MKRVVPLLAVVALLCVILMSAGCGGPGARAVDDSPRPSSPISLKLPPMTAPAAQPAVAPPPEPATEEAWVEEEAAPEAQEESPAVETVPATPIETAPVIQPEQPAEPTTQPQGPATCPT